MRRGKHGYEPAAESRQARRSPTPPRPTLLSNRPEPDATGRSRFGGGASGHQCPGGAQPGRGLGHPYQGAAAPAAVLERGIIGARGACPEDTGPWERGSWCSVSIRLESAAGYQLRGGKERACRPCARTDAKHARGGCCYGGCRSRPVVSAPAARVGAGVPQDSPQKRVGGAVPVAGLDVLAGRRAKLPYLLTCSGMR